MMRLAVVLLGLAAGAHAFSAQGLTQLRMSDSHQACSRRDLLRAGFGVALGAATGAPLAAIAAPSGLSLAQAPLQDRMSPGHWFGQFLGVNSHSETWQVDVSAEDLIGTLVEVLEGLTEKQKGLLLMPNLEVAEKSANKLRVRTWTKLEWLDVLEVSCVDTDDGCVAKVSFFATGFLPTSIPGAPILNVALAPMPFASPAPTSKEYPVEVRGGMLQNFRIRQLKDMVAEVLETDVELAPRGICKVGDYAKENFVSCWSMLLMQG